MISGEQEWLNERLLEHRKIALSGALDREASSRVAAALAQLDATSDEPVMLWLSSLTADLDATFTLVDTLERMRAPVHATCVGTLSGGAIVVLAVADHRAAVQPTARCGGRRRRPARPRAAARPGAPAPARVHRGRVPTRRRRHRP